MIEGLRPYPDMRSTGEPWLPSIPVHWEVRRNGRLFSERRETGYPDLPILEVSLRSGVRIRDMDDGKRKQQITDRSVYQRAVKGDIAYNMMRMWQGAVGIAPADGLVSPAYVVATAHDGVDPAYYAYLFRTDDYMKEIDSFSRGIVPDRNRLYWQAFKQMPSAYPSPDEQHLIVRFLDWHGAMTGKLIRAKRRLIALLNEQKQSIIHRAVTRGLDPAAKLKPSGVDWLGDVPEHWSVAALRHRYEQCLGKMLDTKQITGQHLMRYLRNQDVQWERINTDSLPTMDIRPEEVERCTVRPGDLLVCEGGKPGRAAIWEGDGEPCGFQKALHRLRAIDEQSDFPQFLLLQLQIAVALDAFAEGDKSTIAHLTGEMLRASRFVFPPADEQNAIVQWVGEERRQIDGAIRLAQDEITFVQEFRTRLIADVVTGQLDVRAVAADLPDVAETDTADDLTDEDELDDDADDLIDEEEAA